MNEDRLYHAKDLAKNNEITKITIGVRQEKTLHQIIKYYLEPNEIYHEIPVGRMYADIKINEHIYEVQTQQFNAMRHKLEVFLPNFEVTIVFPIANIKIINLINQYGEVTERKSPKKGNPFALFVELYKIKNYLKDPHLNFMIIMANIDEIRQVKEREHFHSKGYQKVNQIPTQIVNEYYIKDKLDYYPLFDLYPTLLNNNFMAKDFAKVTKMPLNKAQTVLNVLTYLEIVKRIGKNKNSIIYHTNF